MLSLLLLTTPLFLSPAHAGSFPRPAAEPLVQFISLCGRYEHASRSLVVTGGEKVDISIEGEAPEEDGTFCFRGTKLYHFRKETSWWEFTPKSYALVQRQLRYPVLLCSVLAKAKFETSWNGETLRFSAPKPALGAAYGWCSDGRTLPRKDKDGAWTLDSAQFRELPDPNLRSSMSIGNQ